FASSEDCLVRWASGETSAGVVAGRCALDCSAPTLGSALPPVEDVAPSGKSGAFQPSARASSRPRRVGTPAPTPWSARPSPNPASTRDISLNVHTLEAPRVGTTG